MNCTVHLVRHGEVYNPQHITYGRLPGFGLSERGREQARAAALWLQKRPLDALYCSPMQRAGETAAILAPASGSLPPQVDERLNEVFTPWQGRPLLELLKRDWDLYSGSGPEYEQAEDVARRGQDFFAAMRRAWPGGEVAAVTHGDIIAFSIVLAAGDPPDVRLKAHMPNYGVSDDYPETASISSFHWRTADPDELPTFTYRRPW
ncbi:MAG: histidine phosphatase family protein [Anaerolineaceae bacterium]|nr:histidine phosphatase family protein [Anaerolineaceae bacterium]